MPQQPTISQIPQHPTDLMPPVQICMHSANLFASLCQRLRTRSTRHRVTPLPPSQQHPRTESHSNAVAQKSALSALHGEVGKGVGGAYESWLKTRNVNEKCMMRRHLALRCCEIIARFVFPCPVASPVGAGTSCRHDQRSLRLSCPATSKVLYV